MIRNIPFRTSNVAIKNHILHKKTKTKTKQIETIVYFFFSCIFFCNQMKNPKQRANLKNRGIIRVNTRPEFPKHVVATVHGARSGGPADESREGPTNTHEQPRQVEQRKHHQVPQVSPEQNATAEAVL